MDTTIQQEIKISVKVNFRSDLSDFVNNHFFFNYLIDISNTSNESVQLISRHWEIFDSLHDSSIVEGMGVIGEQPIIHPGKSFDYMSGCELFSDMGSMKGMYRFISLKTGTFFNVPIPEFQLIFPTRLN
ncbi:MAG: Co2+/Mg2+ efflux protein ApaG [Crocinitomicaceae bacterium]|nr:Co2+/Mg2+ efflux protein ApaG [Crocinitomicaceae bacterium]